MTFHSVCTENSVAAPVRTSGSSCVPGEVAGEPFVLRVVQEPDEAAALQPDEDASDPADVFRETSAGLAHEGWGEERFGVHDENGVIVAELWEEEVEDLIQGPRPLALVADRDEDVRAR